MFADKYYPNQILDILHSSEVKSESTWQQTKLTLESLKKQINETDDSIKKLVKLCKDRNLNINI